MGFDTARYVWKAYDLVDGGLATLCATALGCAVRIFTSIVTDDQELPHNAYPKFRQGWSYVNSGSHGRGFINTIRRYLPEVADSERLMDAMELSSACTFTEAVGKYEQAVHVISAACCCCERRRAQKQEWESHLHSSQASCQTILVEVISELVQIISSLLIPIALYPARSGVEDLYWNRMQPGRKLEQQDRVYRSLLMYRSRNILVSAKDLFTGRSGKDVLRGHSAKASGGLCFIIDKLIHMSAKQEQCNHLHIIPGRIEWEGNIFDEAIDFPREPISRGELQYEAISSTKTSSTSLFELKDTSTPDLACDLIIEEFGGNHAKSL